MPRAINTLLFCMLLAFAVAAPAAPQRSILVFGDSLSAAYGIAQARGWVALLADELRRERLDYIVVNASISGETTSGGAARIGQALEKHRPAVIIVELGGNDGMRGQSIPLMKANLSAIIEQSQKAGARVLLVGMKLPPNYGADYTQAFERSFADLAKRYKTVLLPFLLEGIAEKRELFLPDGIHPTESAQPMIMRRMRKALAPLLK
jgi:acyl-CoA thioesterase I